MNGYDSSIVEHHSKPGGLAAAWRRGEYLIDGGIHFLIAHKPPSPIYDVYREIGVDVPESTVDMMNYLRFVDDTGEREVNFTSDLQQLERDLIAISPEDEKEIRQFLREVDWMKGSPLLTDLGMSAAPPELKGRFDSLKEMWQMRGFMKYFYGKYSRPAAEFAKNFHSQYLRTIFENLFSPDGPIWFVIMILATVGAGQLGLLKRGCPGFVLPIEQKYKDLGGKIRYNATVDKILVEDDRAVGVLLRDGSQQRADVVVSAADGRNTIFGLLGGRYVDDRIKKVYNTWKQYEPSVVVSLGVARTFEHAAPLNMFVLKDSFMLGQRTIKFLPLRVFNYSDAFAPSGKSVIQVMLETDWGYWDRLHRDKDSYDAEKQHVAEMIIQQLETVYPGMRSQIEMVDVATPITTWRYTLNHQGSPMGWLMTKETLMTRLPRRLPGLNDFYMAGQWILPGGGVPGCIYSGRNVIQLLCKEEKRAFHSGV